MLKPGETYGKLEIIKYDEVFGHLCKCECGNYVYLDHDYITRKVKTIRNCGCVNKRYNRVYQYDGIIGTIKELCDFFNVSYTSSIKKLNHGWNIEDCIEIPYKFCGRLYDLNGWQGSVFHFSCKYNIPEHRVRRKLKEFGGDISRVIDFEILNKQRIKMYNHHGETGTLKELCETFKLDKDVVYQRLYNGWSVKDAFEKPISKAHGITGERFSHLTVIKRIVMKDGIGGWLCECDCGKYVEIRYSDLASGKRKSCGCHRGESNNKIPKPGERFGKLVVIEDTGERSNSGRPLLKCKCDCGNICIANSNYLKRGAKKSCGCLRNKRSD